MLIERGPDLSESDEEFQVNELQEYLEYRKLGAAKIPCSLEEYEVANQHNPAFSSFRKKLSNFLRLFLPAHNIPLPGPPGSRSVKLQSGHKVQQRNFFS